MSYRIYLNIEKKNKINDYLKRTEDTYWNESSELSGQRNELFDETPIRQFTPIERFKDQEHPPYILNKEDFQKILDFYKKFILEDLKEKEFKSRTTKHNKSFNYFFYGLKGHFQSLIKKDINIMSSSVFILDYFDLVRQFENMVEDECVIIKHG